MNGITVDEVVALVGDTTLKQILGDPYSTRLTILVDKANKFILTHIPDDSTTINDISLYAFEVVLYYLYRIGLLNGTLQVDPIQLQLRAPEEIIRELQKMTNREVIGYDGEI